MDSRYREMQQWLTDRLGGAGFSLAPASADASFRRYFRVTRPGESLIVMDAPPAQEDTRPYTRIARRFYQLGLNVPRILEEDADNGFLLLSDLGDRTYLQELTAATADRLYGDAMAALVILQVGTYTDPQGSFLPVYDRALLLAEMELFREWLCGRHLGRELDDTQHQALDRVFALLADSALEQPQVWVHRDYHSRNLMWLERHNPGILDFQDAVLGPITYDLVSLLRDCYIEWPAGQVTDWTRGYFRLARHSGLPVGEGDEDEQRFLRWFDLMGVQRHLKAAGIFARLYHRDGKPGYLGDIPRTLGYITQVGARYPELAPLCELLDTFDANALVTAGTDT